MPAESEGRGGEHEVSCTEVEFMSNSMLWSKRLFWMRTIEGVALRGGRGEVRGSLEGGSVGIRTAAVGTHRIERPQEPIREFPNCLIA